MESRKNVSAVTGDVMGLAFLEASSVMLEKAAWYLSLGTNPTAELAIKLGALNGRVIELSKMVEGRAT